MQAIIKTGGKQYLVKEGDVIRVEKLLGEENARVVFDEVLFVGSDTEAQLAPAKVKVEGIIRKQTRSKKVTGVKHKAKKRYKVTFGHRQMVTEVEITKVNG